MPVVNLPHKFILRDYQKELWKAFFERGIKNIYWLLHRRAGKDKTCINIIVAAACQRVGTYFYLFPQHNQARKVIWKAYDAAGMRFLDHIPPELIHKINNTDMSIELLNGSIIQLVGSDNYNALMGTNPVGIVYSEFSLHHPMARQLLSPILIENGGWEILQGTPRGKNHAYDVYENVRHNPRWFVKVLTIEDTRKSDGSPIVTPAQIEEERRNGMPEELIKQEFYCSFNVGVVGSYYTEEIEECERDNRIGAYQVLKGGAYTFWDLGISDATSIWVMQPQGGHLHLIHYYESTGKGISHYIDHLEDYKRKSGISHYEAHYAPHDIRQRDWVSARSRIELAREAGIAFRVVPNVLVEDGIQAVKSIFGQLKFHHPETKQGMDALREYRREYDEANKTFKQKPLHNWASHCADAFRYFAVTWRDLFTRPDLNKTRTYDFGMSMPEGFKSHYESGKAAMEGSKPITTNLF